MRIYNHCSCLVTLVSFCLLSNCCFSQNVGVNTITPTERLDVNGNINVTGTIKANGIDGTPNQVLMKNTAGDLTWGNICEYKNFVTLTVGAGSWTVPASTTKILVEVWAGGGGGNVHGGGGGGGYIRAHFTVIPGASLNYSVGVGGTAATNATATNGSNSNVSIAGQGVTALGGTGAIFLSAVLGSPGTGGGYGITSIDNYIALPGSGGLPQEKNFMPFNATTYYETGRGGRGGNAGNMTNNGGVGAYYVYNNTAAAVVSRNTPDLTGQLPGGGGAGGINHGPSAFPGGTGGAGLIVIHY